VSGIAVFAAALAAQVTSSEILGTVRDRSGGVVPDARITAKNLETNAVQESVTDAEGRFRFRTLTPGTYEVTVTKPGFSRHVRGPMTIRLNQAADLDVALEVSAVGETVSVVAEAAVVNTTTAEVGVNFEGRRIAEVPLAPNRNILNLALNVAGVNQISRGQSEFSNAGTSGTDASPQLAVNGMRTRSNNFMVDGQDVNDSNVTGLNAGINNPDIVAEFRLITNQFLAEYGRSAGSVMNIVTKSGTNELHGSAFWFHNSNRLNSRSNLDKNLFTRAPWRINNQAGFSVGGPVWLPKVYNGRDKTFFFVSGQKWTDRKLGSGSTINGALTAEGKQMLQPYANRPAVKALLDFLPAAQVPGAATAVVNVQGGPTLRIPLGRLSGAATNTFDDWQWMYRVDHRFSEKHLWTNRYLYDDYVNDGTGQATPPGVTAKTSQRKQALTSGLTSTISPLIYSELRGSFNRIGTVTSGSDPLAETIPSIEVNELGLTGFNAAASRTGLGLAVNYPQARRANLYQVQETVGVLRGSHAMKFGIDFRQQHIASLFVPTIRGRLAYATLSDLVNDVALSTQINAPLKGGQPWIYYRFYDYFFFLQDEWRVNSRLTLSYGLRYELPGNPMSDLERQNAPVVAANGNDARFRLEPVPPRDRNNWSPRFGFNYRLMNDTVLRGGYSRTYDFGFINIMSNVSSAFPFLYSDSLPANTPNSYTALQALVANLNPADPNSLVRTTVAGDFRSPYAEQFSVQLQRQAMKDWAFTLGWVGTKGTALFQTVDGNPTVPGTNGTRRVDPTIGIRRVRANTASSVYHSLQAGAEKRFSSGFSLGATYTWSAFIDNASEIFNPAVNGDVAVSQDSFNRRADRGRSTYDRPHRFTTTWLYELPFMREQQGVLGRVLGGWQVTGFLTFQSGAPFTPLAGIDPGRRLTGIDGLVGNAIRANVNTTEDVSGMNLTDIYAQNLPAAVLGSRNALFTNVGPDNTAGNCYNFPTCLGNAGRNILRADGIGNLELGVLKRVRISENHHVEYRAEFYDLTNTRNFGIPESRLNSANFANQWGTDGGNRRIQMGLRYAW
jgi:hypothetical protein